MDLDFKVEKVNALSKELEEAEAVGGIRGSEEEFSSLKRQKHELELKSKDQEEELDDLAGQVQMLELAKTKLEMDLAAGKRHRPPSPAAGVALSVVEHPTNHIFS